MTGKTAALLLVATLLVACSDSAECGTAGVCTPEGADLEVVSVTPSTVSGTHPVSGFAVVDSLVMTYSIRNVGRSASESAVIRVGLTPTVGIIDTIPPVQAGQVLVRTVRFPSSDPFIRSGDANADRRVFRVEVVEPLSDPGPNSKLSDTLHLRRPIIDVSGALPSEPRVRVNDPFRASVIITNHSAIAPARDLVLRHCLSFSDLGCAYDWTAFGRVAFPDLQPGDTKSLTYMTAISPTAFEYRFPYYAMSTCLTLQSDTSTFHPPGGRAWACDGVGYVNVIPNFEVCSPPVLSAQTVTLNAPNCGHFIPSPLVNLDFRYRLMYVFALDVIAGQTYHVTITDPRSSRVLDFMGHNASDLDPAEDRVRFAESGRYYFVQERWEGVTTGTATVVQ